MKQHIKAKLAGGASLDFLLVCCLHQHCVFSCWAASGKTVELGPLVLDLASCFKPQLQKIKSEQEKTTFVQKLIAEMTRSVCKEGKIYLILKP
jgi:hypothetical protein